MISMEQLQQAIGRLSRLQREDLAAWIRDSADFGDHVAEAAPSYFEPSEQRLLSVEDYLQMEEDDSTRYEYLAGEIFAMSSPTMRHEAIVVNLLSTIHVHLRGGPCKVFPPTADVRLRVERDDVFYKPDIKVACGSFDAEAWQRRYLTNPCLVIEVLSPSTEAIDRREKARNYPHIASLEEYVMIAQKPQRVLICRRSEDWIPVVVTAPDAVAELRSIRLSLPLQEIYDGVS
jgi:Uma2 family endonuclease